MSEYDVFVRPVQELVRSGDTGLSYLPTALIDLLRHEAWRRFTDPLGRVVEHRAFASFAEAKPPDGLGSSVAQLRGLVEKSPVSERAEALRLIRQASKAGKPGPRAAGEMKSQCDPNPTGNATDYALQRLHDQRPDLYEDVVAGRLSVNAAAVSAGHRRPTATIRTDDPARAVAVLLRHYDRQAILDALGAAP